MWIEPGTTSADPAGLEGHVTRRRSSSEWRMKQRVFLTHDQVDQLAEAAAGTDW